MIDPSKLIAGELDLEVPDLDLARVDAFLQESWTKPKLDTHENNWVRAREVPYPWERRVIYHQDLWVNGFDDHFPDLVKLVDALPIRSVYNIFIHQIEQPGYDFFYHFDTEWPFGFRILFNVDTDKPFLEFSRMHPELRRTRYASTELFPIRKTMLAGPPLDFTPLKRNTVLLVNGAFAPHRVPLNNPSKRRTALVIQGHVDLPVNLKFSQVLY